jgi:threonine synthase
METETGRAVEAIVCGACGTAAGGAPFGRCDACGGALQPRYDPGAVDGSTLLDPPDTMWAYASLLPATGDPVTMAEGGTPLVDCPPLAAELGVDRVFVKDDGRNPTGHASARGCSVALTAARATGASDIGLASTGPSAVAAAAYAGRAGIDAHAFVPSRTPFAHKALVNVHGGDMTVVGGRFDDAAGAYAAQRDADWTPVGAFASSHRVAGAATALLEIAAEATRHADERQPVDAVVCPVGEGVAYAGLRRAADLLDAVGIDPPALHAVQSTGCAPLVNAVAADADGIDACDTPDTIAGDLEIPEPDDAVLRAVRAGPGRALAVDDDDVLDAGVRMAASAGHAPGVAGAAAAAGAWELAAEGAIGPEDTVVLYAPGTAAPDADVLRARLMTGDR